MGYKTPMNLRLLICVAVLLAGAVPVAAADCPDCRPIVADENFVGHFGPSGSTSPLRCRRCAGVGGDGIGGKPGCYQSEQEMAYFGPDCNACCHVNWASAPEYTDVDALTQRFQPSWYASADGVFLMYDASDPIVFAQDGFGNSVLSSDDLDFEFEGGGKFLLSYAFTDDFLVEAVYLGAPKWDDTRAIRDASPNGLGGTGNIRSLLGDFMALPGVGLANFASLSIRSQMDSFELNYRRRVGLICGPFETSLMMGVRYVNLRESLNFITISDTLVPNTNDLRVRTQNHLIGLQAGGLAAYRISDKTWFEGDIKVGLYQNSVRMNSEYTVATPAGVAAFAHSDHRGEVAVIGDFDFRSHVRLTRNLSMHIGYQLIVADGLALARDNVETNLALLTLGPAQVQQNGLAFFHGPHLGGVLSW